MAAAEQPAAAVLAAQAPSLLSLTLSSAVAWLVLPSVMVLVVTVAGMRLVRKPAVGRDFDLASLCLALAFALTLLAPAPVLYAASLLMLVPEHSGWAQAQVRAQSSFGKQVTAWAWAWA